MRILSIGKILYHTNLSITSIMLSELTTYTNIESYSYIIISGGDGTIRRVIKILQNVQHSATFIINPTGSFNIIAKMHKVPKVQDVLNALGNGNTLLSQNHQYYALNKEVFLFSAGNMGDLQHIFLAESLRFGILQNNMFKYILAVLFLLPLHLIMTPFMLLSSKRFFIFTPVSFIKKLGSFYGEVKEMRIDLENAYNYIELDGDIVNINENILNIKPLGYIKIVTGYSNSCNT